LQTAVFQLFGPDARSQMKLLVTHLLVIRKNKIVEKDVVPSIELNVVRKILAVETQSKSYSIRFLLFDIRHRTYIINLLLVILTESRIFDLVS